MLPPPRELLVTPPPRPGESLRGFTLRVAERNGADSLFREHFETLRHCTAKAVHLQRLAGASLMDLWRRVSCYEVGADRKVLVRIGNECFGSCMVRLSSRSVCPACVAEGWSSKCVWELHAYKACHVHGVLMASRCDGCSRKFVWNGSLSPNCTCGRALVDVSTGRATAWQRQLGEIIARAAARTLAFDQAAAFGDRSFDRTLRLDRLLLLMEVMRFVVLPKFVETQTALRPHVISCSADELIATSLLDEDYRDYLWDAVFLHAAGKPFQMVEMLRPGNGGLAVAGHFGLCADELSLPRPMWDLANGMRRRRKSRARPFDPRLHGTNLWRAGRGRQDVQPTVSAI